uniref:Uncharacterized protein n=1 Tax=Meloidogyne enterolobii TaxID=390850 RepID=A0A6V7U7W2_MELEN|nr:unnamed protein product [Meloidogyne enterolobii]
MSENDKKLISRSRSSKPSLELYKPPVLRGKKSLPRKVQDVQSESLEKNIQKEISLLSLNEENKEEASQLLKSPLKILSKPTEISQKQQKQSIKKSEEKVKPSMNFDDLINNLRLFLSKDLQNEIGEFLILNCSPEMAKYVGIFIVKYLVEDCCKNNKKYLKKGILSKLYTSLFNTAIFKYFYNGIILSFERYFECKNKLRNLEEIKEEEEENSFYFLVWQNFIFLIFELAQICNEEGIINLIFNIFDYLLNEPVLNSLKIFELESILSLLMIIGHRLELDYPLQTDELRILLRNASLNSTECWARKMILLMVELGLLIGKLFRKLKNFIILCDF